MVDQSAWKLLSELVHLPHELPQITNPELRDRAAAFGTGLILSAKLTPQESNVLLLLNDSIGTLLFLPAVGSPYVSERLWAWGTRRVRRSSSSASDERVWWRRTWLRRFDNIQRC